MEFDLVDYLKTPPTKATLQTILFKIGGNASDLLRTNEKEYKILGLENATDEQILHAITNYPVLLQRPIVITANNAIIARPPEKALEIL